MGRRRYRSQNQKFKEKNQEASTKYGQKLAKASLPSLESGVRSWLTSDKAGFHRDLVTLLTDVPVKVISDISCRVILDSISIQQPLTTVAIKIGSYLEEESRLRVFKKEHPNEWGKLKASIDKRVGFHYRKYSSRSLSKRFGIEWQRWTTKEKIKIGSTMIHIFIRQTGLIEVTTIISGDRKQQLFVKPVQSSKDWIKNFNEINEGLAPLYLPSESPNGYSEVFINSTSASHWNILDKSSLKAPSSALKRLQNVPWKINKEVYDTAAYFWNNQYQVADFPTFALDNIPPKPPDFDTNEESRKNWKYNAAKYYREDVSLKGERLRISKILWVAKEYLDKTMYFPHQMDFRGRAYCIPNFLNPQGPDLARGLLRFDREVEVGNAHNALVMAGSNLFGGFGEEDWQQNVKSVVEDSTQNLWWTKAKKPWQFLAWCFDYSRSQETGKTSLPVSIDASSNGLQILSLLLRDEKGAKWTNLTGADEKFDIYEKIRHHVEEELKIPLDRDLVKSIVMTIPYGCTLFRAKEIVLAWMNRRYTKESLAKANSIAKTIIITFSRLYPKYTEVLNQLKKFARDQKDSINWITPSGFPICSEYRKEKILTCSSYILGKAHSLTYREPTDALDLNRISRSFAPNFVHSLDASIMHLTLSSTAIKDVYAIHDCFGCHVPYLEEMLKDIKRSYLKTFRGSHEDFFKKIFSQKTQQKQCYSDFMESFSKIIGKFSVDEIWHSKYLYS